MKLLFTMAGGLYLFVIVLSLIACDTSSEMYACKKMCEPNVVQSYSSASATSNAIGSCICLLPKKASD